MVASSIANAKTRLSPEPAPADPAAPSSEDEGKDRRTRAGQRADILAWKKLVEPIAHGHAVVIRVGGAHDDVLFLREEGRPPAGGRDLVPGPEGRDEKPDSREEPEDDNLDEFLDEQSIAQEGQFAFKNFNIIG